MTPDQRIESLEAEVRDQRRLIIMLAKALHTHTRTDMAPDAALPLMALIVEDAQRGVAKKKRRRP
jgi:hypothetical protein